MLRNHGNLVRLCRYEFNSVTKGINNVTATKWLKDLYQKNGNPVNNDTAENQIIMENAFRIFDQVTEPKNHFVINTMLKLCITCANDISLQRVWDYIKTTDKKIHENISYSLIMKYHINSMNVQRSIDTLKWIGKHGYKLNIHGSLVNKLILQCETLSNVKYIHQLIDKDIIQNCDNAQIGTTLLKAYGKFGDVDSAEALFEGTDAEKKDIVMICGMMKVFITSKQYKRLCNYTMQSKIRKSI